MASPQPENVRKRILMAGVSRFASDMFLPKDTPLLPRAGVTAIPAVGAMPVTVAGVVVFPCRELGVDIAGVALNHRHGHGNPLVCRKISIMK